LCGANSECVGCAQVGGQQQYVPVPVSVMEPSGRQMLLTNAVQTTWPTNRQMAIVPSWQQLPAHQGTIQQPLLSDAGDAWGRSLIVDSSAILQASVSTSLAITLLNVRGKTWEFFLSGKVMELSRNLAFTTKIFFSFFFPCSIFLGSVY